MTRILSLALVLSLLVGLSACSSRSKQIALPALSLAPYISSSDSTARFILLGKEESAGDSLDLRGLEGDALSYTPDSTRYHALWLILGEGQHPHYFQLRDGAWHEAQPTEIHPDSLQYTPSISGQDVKGRLQHIYGATRHKQYCLIFSDRRLHTITKKLADSLTKTVRPDTLQLVYLMLTDSDSSARNRLRHDSLSGITFSDTLGIVTELRRGYGIERLDSVALFRLDSTSHIPQRFYP